ncbi:MAG: hypothetical protein NW216_02435 [Hyphomicrobium sp.]|nr:hypothetical protein [Hyphomicrobium sp.]
MMARKLMLLGEIGVGKSSLVRRLVFDTFEFDYKPTIGVDIYRYDVPDSPGRDAMTLIVWDTDGNFSDAIFRHVYMREAVAALIVGDVMRPETLQSMVKLSDGFKTQFPGRHAAYVVNKTDLLGENASPSVPSFLQGRGIETHLTSARTGSAVQNAFHEAANVIQRRGL